MSKAPEWFKKFEEKNDSRWERQEKFNTDQREFNSRQEKINLEIKDSVKDLSLRLDNIVEKNDLNE